jgi:hypothetical protein
MRLFEREMIRQRINAGIARAKRRGTKPGKATPDQNGRWGFAALSVRPSARPHRICGSRPAALARLGREC